MKLQILGICIAARGCLRGEGLAGQWDPLVAVPRRLPVEGPINTCADHVDPAPTSCSDGATHEPALLSTPGSEGQVSCP
jgi:hypothetical protein